MLRMLLPSLLVPPLQAWEDGWTFRRYAEARVKYDAPTELADIPSPMACGRSAGRPATSTVRLALWPGREATASTVRCSV